MAVRPKPAADGLDIPSALDIDTTAATPAAAPAPAVRPVRTPKPAKGGWWWGTGRRKRAVARVRIKPAQGSDGKVTICLAGTKTKTVEQYFAEERDRNDAVAPLKVSNTFGKLDVFVRLAGGGYMGQAGAMKMGIARALRDYDPTTEASLRETGMLTRDAREVERKKYGQSGARRRFQFSKR
jgi:small subunit ribosomal protein S9